MKRKVIVLACLGFLCLASWEATAEPISPASLEKVIKREKQPARVQSGPIPALQRMIPGPKYEPTLPWPTSAGTFPITNQYFFENTAQVIAPHTNSACPTGQVVVSIGQDVVSGTTHKAFYRNLYDFSGWYDSSAVTKEASFPISSQHELGTDNLLIKLKDGSLMAIRNGITWESVATKPAWWDKVTIQNHPKGARVGAFVWRSTDCGKTWTRLSIIDPINYENGRYAVPRPTETGCPAGCYGGWDRTEAYADPWTGYVYVTVNAAGGPIVNYSTNTQLQPADYTHFLFRSRDGGKTWQQILRFGAWTPIVISSTPNGRIYLYTVIGDQPTLYYSRLGTEPPQFSQPKQINYWVEQGGVRTKIPSGVDKTYGDLVYKATNSISRISTDTSSSKVRLSYPWVDANGRSALAVIKVEVPNETAEPLVSPVAMFRAVHASNSILSSSFIEPDPAGSTVARTNASVLYWVEGSTDPTQDAYVRYSIFRGEVSGTLPAILAGPYKPTVSVAHYMYGGSFFPSDGSFNYLAQWVQQDGIRANIVTIPPYSPGVKLPQGGGPFNNVDLPGSDIAHIEMDPPPSGFLDLRQYDCSSACGNNKDCVAWTYVKPNTIQGPKGNCWLKNRVPQMLPNTCCTSGTVGESGVDRPGGDYLHFDNIFGNEVTPQFCQAICFQQSKCKAWTFVNPNKIQGRPKGVCWLKETVPPRVKNADCISGYFDIQVIK